MLKVGYLSIASPITVTTSASGEGMSTLAGQVLLEGFNLDEMSVSELEGACNGGGHPRVLGFSARGREMGPLLEAASYARENRYLMELDLTGRSDLNISRLSLIVKAIKEKGAALSLRVRADLIDTPGAKALQEAGLDLLNLDVEGLDGISPRMVRKLSDGKSSPIMVTGRFGDFGAAKRLLSMGASLVCLKNPDPEFADWLTGAMSQYERLIGWYNAPKHICSGGDLRGLAFCCPPVKSCPVLGALKKAGMTPEEFVHKKQDLARGTPLQFGDGTCFGSLVWCCKISKPCFMRDAVLQSMNLSESDYMNLKRQLADELLK
ncbi:MAG: methanogenesis marker 9 domain-containing protein [Methanosarcinales archaeon]|nr:methanogenesis marker 9 domain-containing protein [Methanosarcinales archaeon]